jgi:hypothetical protein
MRVKHGYNCDELGVGLWGHEPHECHEPLALQLNGVAQRQGAGHLTHTRDLHIAYPQNIRTYGHSWDCRSAQV